MKRKIFFLFSFFFFLFSFLRCQNLVPNPSFENYTTCPNSSGQIYYAIPWFQPNVPFSTTTSEYYNQCNTSFFGVPENFVGYQFARTGSAYAGIELYLPGGGGNSDYREYIEVKLIDSLKSEKKYCVSFYASLIHYARYGVNSIGAYFSSDSILHNTPPDLLFFTPQIQNQKTNMLSDTINWMEVRDTFVAVGGERFMTIGNFYPDSLTDTLLNYPSGGASYYYIDDVSVVMCDSGDGINEFDVQRLMFNVFPNPVAEYFEIIFERPVTEKSKIELYDVWGKKISEYEIPNGIGRKRISLESFESGIYFCKLIVGGFAGETKKIAIMK